MPDDERLMQWTPKTMAPMTPIVRIRPEVFRTNNFGGWDAMAVTIYLPPLLGFRSRIAVRWQSLDAHLLVADSRPLDARTGRLSPSQRHVRLEPTAVAAIQVAGVFDRPRAQVPRGTFDEHQRAADGDLKEIGVDRPCGDGLE